MFEITRRQEAEFRLRVKQINAFVGNLRETTGLDIELYLDGGRLFELDERPAPQR